jgi:hypothetical protein
VEEGKRMVNPGYEAGVGKRSEKIQLGFRIAGAKPRKKDLKLSALSGVAEGRKLRERISAIMKGNEANPEDALVYIVFAEPDLSAFAACEKPGMSSLPELNVHSGASDIEIANCFAGKLPIGFLIFVWDKKSKQQPIFGHARPLIVEDSRSLDLNERALAEVERVIKRRLNL